MLSFLWSTQVWWCQRSCLVEGKKRSWPRSIASASMTASKGGGSMAFCRKAPTWPSLNSLMDRASSWSGVRKISGVVCCSSLGEGPEKNAGEGYREGKGKNLLFKSGPGAEMEGEPGTYTTRPALTLLQVGFGAPHSGVIGHVVVRGEKLHFSSAKSIYKGRMGSIRTCVDAHSQWLLTCKSQSQTLHHWWWYWSQQCW